MIRTTSIQFLPLYFFALIAATTLSFAETLERFAALEWTPNQQQAPPQIDGFTAHGGNWSAADGILNAPAGQGPKLICNASACPTDKPFEAQVEFLADSRQDGNIGLICCVTNPSEGADNFCGYEFALFLKKRNAIIGRHENNFRMLASKNLADGDSIPEQSWVELKLKTEPTADGLKLELFLNGKKYLEAVDPTPLKPGKLGLRPWQRSVQYRNLTAANQQYAFAPPKPEPKKTVPWPESLQTADLPSVLVVCRAGLTQPNSVGLDFWQSKPKQRGCSLKILHPSDPKREVQTIFDDPDGCIYDANLTADAQSVLFSYRPKDAAFWHIYRIRLDGSNLKQLTDGDFYDVSPCETPDGRIVFVSNRRFGHTVCQPGPSSNLFRMNPDGTEIACVSMNTLSDFNPQMLPDGRILFTRWEYIDRDLTYRQSLWTQNPDGTGYQLYFGNTVRNSGSFLQSRPIPGRSDLVVSTFTSHHGYPHGAIGLIHRGNGPESDLNESYEYITKEYGEYIGDHSREFAYRDPFPLSEDRFLCAYGSNLNGETKYRIYLLDRQDQKRLLYEDSRPGLGCFCPLPIVPSRNYQIASVLNGGDFQAEGDTGTVLLVDVYRGLEPWVKRGQVKKLRIMEQVRKSVDLNARAYDQSPVMSYATYYAKRCWGEVPVESDGSAYFEIPALREIYLQALDEQGRELQRMTSALQVMPNQQLSCVGCHENRTSTPVSVPGRALPIAAAREPSVPQLPSWWSQLKPVNPLPDRAIVSYVSLVQPVLDEYCVRCHSGTNPDGGCDLTGDKTRYFSMSYDNLLGRTRSYRQHNMQTGRILPEEAAKGKPMVQYYWLLFTPSGVNQPLEAGTFASRLTEYIESPTHAGRPIPLEARQRIYFWLDSNACYYNTYAVCRPNSGGKRDLFSEGDGGNLADWFAKDFTEVYNRRCATCHGAFASNPTIKAHSNPTTNWEGRFAWINLSRPELSPALTAHLKQPFGRGISIKKTEENSKTNAASKPEYLFDSPSDADYQKILTAIQTGTRAMLTRPRADMPGFAGQKEEP